MLSVAVQSAVAATLVEQHLMVLSAPSDFAEPPLFEGLAQDTGSQGSAWQFHPRDPSVHGRAIIREHNGSALQVHMAQHAQQQPY